MKRRLIAALCTAAIVLSLAACGGDEKKPTQSADEGGEVKLAYLTPSLDLPFWRYLATGIENEVFDSGMKAKVQVYDSNNSSETQLQNAQDAIARKVDLIIISPTDSSSCSAVLGLAEEAKIPVVIADIGTESGKYDAFIVTPNLQGAEELGDYVLQYMKNKHIEGSAAQITGTLARNNIKARYEGFKASCDKFGVVEADYRQMKKHTRAEAEGFAEDLMTTYPDLAIIFVHMDEPTLGAVKAVQNADKGDTVLVCGFDGTPETVRKIESGELLAAAIQQPALMGKLAVQAAQKIFRGEKVEGQIDVPTVLVTAENCRDEKITKQLKDNVFPESKNSK